MGNKEGKLPQDIIPLYFDHYKQQEREPISQDEVDQLQREMQLMNEQKTKRK
jgi:hypothetical protein